MPDNSPRAPWAPHMGDLPLHLEYFGGTLFEAVDRIAKAHPKQVALDFMGGTVTYRALIANINRTAAALKVLGIKKGERVTVALPNCPQAIYLFYAVNLIGAVANMIHPLSAEKEIEFYLAESQSVALITLDGFYDKFRAASAKSAVKFLIITSVKDALTPPMKLGYALTEGRKIKKLPKNAEILLWRDLMKKADSRDFTPVDRPSDKEAVILYSGGTTGTTKGILLSDFSLNALSEQVIAANPMFRIGDKMLAAMPLFHGFGLGVCIHTMLSQGGRCVLVPRFTAASYAKLMVKKRCSFIAGVPTLYEALLRLPKLEKADLSCLKGVFSGGDSLSVELKKKLDRFLSEHKATVRVREGYGTTETVAACCLTPAHRYKEGSIGLPFSDMYVKIAALGSEEELPYEQEGEILIAGPTVMQGYMNRPDETAAVLQTHKDGLTWVRTGDLGIMDEEGFLFFRGRVKRMIVSSGYNIYPAQIENILDAHELVQMSCVIGLPDSYKMQKVKAFVKLAAGVAPDENTREALFAHCRENIAKYAMPYDIEFRDELPKTAVGKVASRLLEEQELEKLKNQGKEK